MGVNGMHSRSCGVAHKGHAHVLDHTGLHEARVECVSQIVKAKMAQPGAFDPAEPAFTNPRDRSAVIGEDDPGILALFHQQIEQALRKRDLPRFSLGCF